MISYSYHKLLYIFVQSEIMREISKTLMIYSTLTALIVNHIHNYLIYSLDTQIFVLFSLRINRQIYNDIDKN